MIAEDQGQPSGLAVVLSGGGARAAYQVGVLSAIAERSPHLPVHILSGVSAGAINTITLAAHPGHFFAKVKALHNEWARLTVENVYRLRVGGVLGGLARWLGQRFLLRRTAPTVVRGVMDMEPLRAFLSERINFRGIATNITAGRLRAVTLSATSYTTSETITFVQAAAGTETWERAQRRSVMSALSIDHVIASASIPILFPAVKIARAYYGDGSVRQAAPLAPAIHLGADRVLAIGMRAGVRRRGPIEGAYPSAAQVMGMLFHSIFLDTLDTDQERLERFNAILRTCRDDGAPVDGLRPVKLLVVRPSVDVGAMARPHFSRLPPTMRSIVLSIGGQRIGAADFLSYLLFDPAYTVPLMELGYNDANLQWDTIEQFLET